VMDERVRFVGRLLEGDSMSGVCREFGISRKTGYKIWDRYRQEGMDALCDRSRRPVRYANQLPAQIERLIVETKRDKQHLGCQEDPRAAGASACRGCAHAGKVDCACRAGPAWACEPRPQAASGEPGPGYAAVAGGPAQRPLVR